MSIPTKTKRPQVEISQALRDKLRREAFRKNTTMRALVEDIISKHYQK